MEKVVWKQSDFNKMLERIEAAEKTPYKAPKIKKKFKELTKDEEEHAVELYEKSIVLNCLDASHWDAEYLNIIRDSGLTATAIGIRGGFQSLAAHHRMIEENPDIVVGPITTVKEIRRAKEERKIAAFFNAQNSTMLIRGPQPDFDLLPLYHKLGLRILMPTYNTRNIFAEGCAERTDGGLSRYGLELVEKMNKLNILCDSSHMGIQDTLDVCEHADFPVCTHSNARAVCDNPRNRTDEEIKAIAEKDGVLGFVAESAFLKWKRAWEGERPTIDDGLNHIDYIADLVGVEHVGIGLDYIEGQAGPFLVTYEGRLTGRTYQIFERAKRLRPPRPDDMLLTRPDIWGRPGPSGYWEGPLDIDHISKTKNLAKGLVARGYSDREIKGVLGENWLRLFKKAWGE